MSFFLFSTCMQVPCPSGVDVSELLTNQDVPDSSKQIYTGKIPSNLFTLHNGEDCLMATDWLIDNVVNQKGKKESIIFFRYTAFPVNTILFASSVYN